MSGRETDKTITLEKDYKTSHHRNTNYTSRSHRSNNSSLKRKHSSDHYHHKYKKDKKDKKEYESRKFASSSSRKRKYSPSLKNDVKQISFRQNNNNSGNNHDGDDNTLDTINIDLANHHHTQHNVPSSGNFPSSSAGSCIGCGIDGASLRIVTGEHLCANCRQDLRYKLITKTTVLNKYSGINFHDLMNATEGGIVQCFSVKNWHNPSHKPIKLYYEKEIQQLEAQHRKRV